MENKYPLTSEIIELHNKNTTRKRNERKNKQTVVRNSRVNTSENSKKTSAKVQIQFDRTLGQRFLRCRPRLNKIILRCTIAHIILSHTI